MKIFKVFSSSAYFLIIIAYRWAYSTDGKFGTTLLLAVVDMICVISACLIINRLLVPRLLFRKYYFSFTFIFLFIIILFSRIFQFADWQIHMLRGTMTPRLEELSSKFSYQIFNSYIIMVIGTVFGFTIEMLTRRVESEKLFEQLLKEKTEAELNFLKAQINPHFLFNSINTIFFQIEKENKNARYSLLKFSEMLRYQLYDCRAREISIEKEINYLKSYVELQRLRKEDNFKILFECSESVREFNIAPLLLISFVENAFKHVSNFHEKENAIRIYLDKNDNVFQFQVYNTSESDKGNPDYKDGGIGLNNVKRRMELIYNGNHDLNIRKEQNSFEVNLKIQL